MVDRIPTFGVDGETGRLAFEPLSPAHFDALALEEPAGSRGLSEDIEDPDQLDQTGWAVVFAPSVGSEIRDALAGLIAFRRDQVTHGREADERARPRFRDDLVIQRGDTIDDLRRRWGMSPGAIEPEIVPPYLLLVGSPDEIGFELQHDLDVGYFVGRLDLESPAAYRAYAEAVVAAERQPARPRRAVFWGPRNRDDGATLASCDELVRPLAESTRDRAAVECLAAQTATKAALAQQLLDPPALLFTAGHGVYIRPGAAQQRELEGALVTQDWPGPLDARGFALDHRFAASDLGDAALGGLVAILYACFGGGVPTTSRFPYQPGHDRLELADRDFTAALPRALLARGAGAVLAHVDRTWDTGFTYQGLTRPQLHTWRAVIAALLKGKRIGRAVEHLSDKCAAIATTLGHRLLLERKQGIVIPPAERRYAWLQYADTRSWLVHGDPAARLAIAT